MADWRPTCAAFVAANLAACTTPTPPLAAVKDAPSRPPVVDTSLACTEHGARRVQETNAIQLATLDLLANACALPTDDITLANAEAALAGKSFAIMAEGNILSIFQIAEGRAPSICCSLQDAAWRDLGDGRTYAARMHLRDLQSGMLRLTEKPLDQPLSEGDFLTWRGPAAPESPTRKSEITGVLSERVLFSPELGETRKLIIYEPPSRGEGALPVLYLADGEGLPYHARMIEPLIETGKIAPLLIVGMPSGQNGIVEDRSDLGGDIRSMDYLPENFPGEPPSRFIAYLAYMTETLVPWVEREYGPSPDPRMRAISGQSNGGGLSLTAGMRRPDIFGHAWPMSVGIGGFDTAVLPETEPARFRISAGYYEPYFMRSTKMSADALIEAGFPVDTYWYAAGHMDDQWNHRLIENLKAVFPGSAAR